jgi:hypothetical protein
MTTSVQRRVSSATGFVLVPRFQDKQFEHMFQINWHMVDIILNHLVSKNQFSIKTGCRAVKEQ